MDLVKSETSTGNSHAGDGWKKVVHRKRHQKEKPAFRAAKGGVSDNIVPNENLANGDNVFRALMSDSDVEDESNGAGAARTENLKAEETKKLMLSLPEAAAKIDPSHLADFLTQVSEDLWPEPSLQILKYNHFLSEALSEVSFPWEKGFTKPTLSTLIDVPLSHIPKAVYEISVEWINKLPSEILGDFALWACDFILTDWKAQRTSSEHSLVAAFVLVAMVLRGKPDALTVLVPMVRKRPMYLEQDRVLLIVWLTAQASQVDLYAGLYSWARYLLPLVGNKECCSPQSMDLILQLVENILSNPEARTILVNRAVREEERRIPLPSFEILLRLTFPAPSARVKATERFEAIYPLLKEVALVPERGGRMKQIFTFFLKLAGEGNPVLAKEATAIAIWYVTVNAGCFRHWDNLYTENLEASVALLKKIVDEWKDHPLKLSSSPMDTVILSQTMKSFRLKNEKAITEGGTNCSLYKEADKSCKVISGMISGRLHRGSGWLEDFATITTYVLVAAIALVLVFFL